MAHAGLYTKNWSKKLSLQRSPLFAKIRHRLYDPLSRIFFLLTIGRLKIKIQKREYPYFVDWYNYTWTNERTIEISFFSHLLLQFAPQKILEIGNTLSHYRKVSHTIIDKYEVADNVENIDVLNFKPRGTFDLIFSISTFEHIGWHEKEKRAEKALESIEHVRTLLSDNGKLVFSFPIGVNPALDRAVSEKKFLHTEIVFLRRKNRFNMWEVTTYAAVKNSKYNTPYPNANAICIVTLKKKKVLSPKR